ncbi:extracellular solute-binding protein [Cohnella phaseoli]|uniref:N-acetylglucosamine transport system substrate-binding protein n=1 Tax=Cohnella phaseoli TaxID=456490 RepID=A0A3D9I7B7_9BACL|nr:extracellular solute-binding protein [Cohnella phaseoli]RED57066.1 N-acetylglucosamine transport system substrate-binding protein [Cohnella phaseoli]
MSKTGLRKISGLVALILVASLVFSACGKSASNNGGGASLSGSSAQPSASAAQPSASSASADVDVKGDFELQIFVGGYGDAWWKEAIEGFKKKYPEVNVIANMGPKINEQMKTRWIDDNPPDFLYFDGPDIPMEQLKTDGKIMDLSGWFDEALAEDGQSLIQDHFVKGMLTPDKNGKIYVAPYIFSTMGMFYDDKLLGDNQISPPQNFDELLAIGEKLKSQNVALLDYPGIYPVYLFNGLITPALAAEGGQELWTKVMNAEPGVFKSEPFIKVMKKLEVLRDQGLILKGTTALNHTQSQMEWLNRKAAFIPNGLWLEGEMKKDIPTDFQMKFIPSVLQDAGQKMATAPSAVGFAIPAKAKNPKAAMAWLSYLYQEDVVKRFIELTNVPTIYNVDVNDMNVSEMTKSVMKWIADPNIVIVSTNFDWEPAGQQAVYDSLNSLVLGKINAEQYGERVEQAFEKARSEKQ